MNQTNLQFPEGYIPFNELIICSNNFINGKVPIKMKNEIPFLVGKGRIPLVWLYAPTTIDGKNWQEIVIKNQSMSKKIDIASSEQSNSVIIKADENILIEVKKLSDRKAEIVSLDLRLLGLNVYGDTKGVYVGTNLISNNTFNNVHTMIGIS